ncbi:platelet binding protein GspB-like [Chironomus tepperi]|uniref:platelet binding protein GspB-like n=1 Tax=Chironomus tepperi TaxID=113505 RepID=UPI00391F35B1
MNIAGKIKSNEHRKTQADKREPGGSEPKLSSVSNRVEPSQIANLSNNPNLNTISRINGESSSANVHFKTSNGETSIEGIRVHLQPKYPSQLQSNLVESTSYEKDSQAEQIIHNNSIVRHQISNIPQNQASIHPTPRPIYRVDPQSLPSLNPQIKQQMLQNPPKPSTSNVIGQSEQPMKPKQSKSNNKPSRVRRTDAEINRDLELVNKKLASEMNDKRSDTGSKVLQNTSKSSTSSKHPNTTQKPSTIADQQPIIDTTEPCSTRKTKLSSTDVDEIKEIMLKAVEEIKEKIIKKEVAQVIVEKISDVLKSVVSDDEDSEILDEKLGVFVKKSKKGGKSAGTLDDVNKESVGNEPGSQLNNKNLPSVEVHDQFSTTRLNVQSVIPSMTIQTISPSMSSQNVLNVQPTATHMTPGPVNPLISATTAPVPILFSAANIPQNNPYNTSFTTIYTAPVPYHVVNSTPMLMNNTSMSTTVGNPSVNAVNQYGSAQVDVNGNHGPITYLPGIPGNSDRRSGSVGGNLVNYGRNSVNYGRNSTNFCQNSANSSQNLANFPQNSASFSQSLANLPQFDGISSQSPSNFHQNSASFPRNSANLPQNSASYPQNSTIFTQTLINLAQKSASFAQKPPNYANIPASLGHIQPNFNPNHDARVGFGHTSSIRPVTSQSSPKSDIRSQNSPILSDPVHYAQQFRHHHPNYPSVPTSSSEFYSSNLNQVHKVPPTSTHTEPTQEPPEVVTILNLEPAKQSVSLSNLLETSNNILMNNDADSNNLYATTMDEIFFPQNFDDVSTQLTSTCLQNNLLIDDLKVVEDCQVETEGQVKDSAAVADETNLNEETSQNDEGTDTTTDNVEITDTISNLKTESITVSQSNQIDDNSTCKIPINTQNDDNVDCDTSDEQKEEVQNSNTEINNKITTQIDNNDENVQNETHVSSTEVEEDIQACDDTAIVINNTKAIEEEVGVINQDLDSTNDEQTKAPPNDIPVNALDSSMAATSTTNNENLQHNNNQTSAPESVAETDLDQLEVSSFGSYNDQEDPLHEDDFKIPQTTRTTSRSKAVKSNVNSRSSQLSALNSTVRRSTRTRIVSKKVIEGLAALKGLKNKIDEIKDVMSKSEAVDEKEMDVPNSCEQYVESKIQEVTETYSKIAEKSKEIKAEVQCKKGRSQRNVWHKDEAVDIKDGKDDGVNRNAQSQTASKGDCRTESRERSNERQIVDKSCIQTPKDTDSSTKLLKPQDEAEITQKLEDSKSKPSESIRRSLRSRSHVENSVNITSNDSSSIDKATPILEAALKKDDKVPDAEDNEKSSTISPDQNDDKQATLKTIKTPTIEKVERQLRSSSSTKKLSQNSLVSKDKEPIDSSSEASEDHNMLDLLLLDSLNMLSSELLENRRKSENQDGLSKNIQDLMTSDINISKSSEDLTSHIKAGQSHARTERIRTRSNMSEDKDNQIVKLNKEDLEAISPRRSERDSSKTKNQEKSTQNTHNPIEPTKPKEITQNTDNTHQTNFHIRPKTRSSERLTPQISKNPTTLQKTKSFELIAADNSKESRKLRNSESSETDNNVNSSTITQNTPNATQTPLNVNRPTTRQSQKASDSLSLTQSTTTIEKTSEINKIKTDETVVEMPLNDTVPATSDEGSRRVLRNRSKSVDTRRVDKPTISGIFTKFDDSSSREASFSIDNLQKFNTNTSNEGTPAKNTEHEATPSVYKSNTNNRSSHLDESVRYLRNRLVPVDSAMPVESNKKSEPPSSLSHESANNDSQKSKNSRSKSAEPSSQHADNVENSVEIKEEAKSVRSLRSRVVPQIEAANSSIRDKSTDSKDTKAVVNESKSDKSAHLETSNPPESIQVEDVKTTRSGVTWCTQPLAQLSPPSAKSSKPSFSSVFSPISSIQFSQKPENIQSSQPFEDLNVRGLRRHTKIHQSLNKSSTESGDAHQATLDAKDNKSLDSKDNGSSEVRAKSSPDDKCSPNSTDKDSPEAKKQRLQNAITNKLLTINLTSLRSRSRNSDSHVSSEATKSQESQELPLKEPSNNNSLIRRSLHPPAIVSHEILKKILIKPRPNPNVDINKPTQPIKSIREQLLESQRRSRSAEKSKQVDDKVLSENEASKDKQDVKSSENGGNQDSLTISRHSLRSVKVKNAELTHKSTEATESEHRNRTISTTSTESAASLMGKSQPIDNSSINLSRHYTRSTRKIVLSESQSEPKEPSSSHAESAPSKSDKSIQELDQSNTLETQESRSSAKSDHLEPSSQPESLQSEVTKLTRSSSKSPSKPTPQRKPIASESEKIDSDIQQDQSTSITSSTNSEESTQKSEIHEEVKKCVVRLKKLTSEEIYKLTERSSSPSMSTRSTRSSMSSPERPLSRKSSISSDYVIDKRHLELMSSSSRRSSSDSNSDVVPLISLIHRPNLRSSSSDNTKKSSPNVKNTRMSTSVRTLLRQISDERASSTESLPNLVRKNIFNASKLCESSDDEWTLKKYVENLKEKSTPMAREAQRPTRSKLSRAKTASDTEGSQKVVESARRSERHKTNARESIDHSQNKAANAQHLEDTATKVQQQLNEPHEKLAQHSWSELQNQSTNLPESSEIEITTTHSDIEPQSDTILTRDNASKNQDDILLKSEGITSQVQREEEPHVESCQPIDESTKHDESMEDHNLTEDPPESTEFERDENSFTDQKSTLNDETPTQESIPVVTSLNQTELSVNLDTKDSIEEEIVKLDKDESVSNSMSITEETIDDSNDASFPKTSDCTKTDPKNLKEHEIIPTTPMSLDKSEDLTTIVNEILETDDIGSSEPIASDHDALTNSQTLKEPELSPSANLSTNLQEKEDHIQIPDDKVVVITSIDPIKIDSEDIVDNLQENSQLVTLSLSSESTKEATDSGQFSLDSATSQSSLEQLEDVEAADPVVDDKIPSNSSSPDSTTDGKMPPNLSSSESVAVGQMSTNSSPSDAAADNKAPALGSILPKSSKDSQKITSDSHKSSSKTTDSKSSKHQNSHDRRKSRSALHSSSSSHESRHKSRRSSQYSEKSSSEKRKLSTDERKSSKNQQKSSNEHKKSSVEQPKPSVDKQKSSADHKKPSIDHKKPKIDERKPSTESQKSSSEHHKSSSDSQRSSSSKRRHSLHERRQSTNDLEKSRASSRKSSTDYRKRSLPSILDISSLNQKATPITESKYRTEAKKMKLDGDRYISDGMNLLHRPGQVLPKKIPSLIELDIMDSIWTHKPTIGQSKTLLDVVQATVDSGFAKGDLGGNMSQLISRQESEQMVTNNENLENKIAYELELSRTEDSMLFLTDDPNPQDDSTKSSNSQISPIELMSKASELMSMSQQLLDKCEKVSNFAAIEHDNQDIQLDFQLFKSPNQNKSLYSKLENKMSRFEVISFAHDVSQLDKDKFEVNPEIFSKKAQDSIIDFDILSKNKSLLMDIDVDSIKRSLSLISEKVESPNIRPQRTSLRLERKNSQYRCENTQLDEDHQTPKSTNDDNLERQKSLSEPLELNTTSTTSTVTFKPSKSVYSLAVESIPTSSDLLNSSEAPKSDENDDLTSKSLKIDSIASKSPKIDDITSKSSKSDKSTSKLPENEDITSKLPENEDQTSKSLKDDDITSNSPNKDDTIPDILASSTSSSKLSTKEHDVPQNYNKTDPKTPVMPQVYNNFNNKCTVTADKLTQKWIEADDSVRMEEEITEIDVNKVNEIIMDEREVEEAINEIVLNIATAEELSERMEVRNEVELDSIYDKLVGIDDKFPKIIDIPTVETSTNPEQASMDPKSTKLPQSPSKDLDIDHLDSTSNQELIIDESSPDIDEIIHEMSQNDQKSSISNQSNNVPDIQSEESAANVHNMDTVSLLEEEIDVEGGKPTEVEEVAEQIRVDTEKPEEQQVTVDKQSNAATEKLLEQKMTVVEPITDQKLLEQQVARADQVSVESEISQTQKVTETSLEQQLGVANQTCIEIEEHLEDKKPEDEQIGVEVENPGEEQVKGIEQTSDEAQQPLQPHQAKSDEASKPVEQTNISIIPAYCSQLSEDFYDSDSLVIDIDEIDDDKSHDPNDSRLREFPVPVQAVKSELKESDEKSVDNVNNVSHCTDAHKLDDIAQDIATDPLSLVNISTDAAANRSDLDITHSNTAIDPNKSQTTLSTSTYDSSSALHPRPLPWNLQIHYKFPTCPRESAKLPSEVENLKTPSEPTKSDSNSSHKFKKVTENWTSTPTGPSSIRITKASFPNVKEDKKLMKSRRSSTLPSDAPGVFKRIDKFNEIQRSSSQQEPVTPSRYSITSRRSSTSHDSGTSKEILVISKDTSLKDPDYSVKPPKYHKNKAMEVAKKLATPFKSKPVDYFPKKPQNKLKTGIQSKVIASYTTLVRSLTKTTSDELNINDKSVIKEFSARTNEIIKSATSDVRTVRTEPVMTRLRSVSLDSRQVTPTEKKLGQIQSREADWYRDSDFNRVPDNIETQKKSSKPKAARKLLDMPLLDLPGPSPHTEIVEQYIQQPSIQVPVPQIQPSMQLPVPQIQPKNTVEIINNSSGNIISTVDAYRKEIQSITEESPAVGFKKKFIFNDGSEMVVDDAGNGGKNSNQDIIIEILNNISDQEVVDVPKKSSRRKITQKRPKRIESPKQQTMLKILSKKSDDSTSGWRLGAFVD